MTEENKYGQALGLESLCPSYVVKKSLLPTFQEGNVHKDADDKFWHKDLEWINLHQSKGVKRRKKEERGLNKFTLHFQP